MGSGVGQNSALPGVIASGVLVSTAAAGGSVALSAAYRCSAATYTSAGVLAVKLEDRANGLAGLTTGTWNIVAKAGSIGNQLLQATPTAYNATTGVLTITIVTATTGVVLDGACWFEVTQAP